MIIKKGIEKQRMEEEKERNTRKENQSERKTRRRRIATKTKYNKLIEREREKKK